MSAQTTWESAEQLLDILLPLNVLISVKLRQDIDEEVTMAQFRILAQLQEQPLTLSELAEQRQVSRQAASLQIQGLVERGWVRRIPDPKDRRQARLKLTQEGIAQWRQTQQALTETLVEHLDLLTPDELAALRVIIPAFKRSMERQRTDGNAPLEEQG